MAKQLKRIVHMISSSVRACLSHPKDSLVNLKKKFILTIHTNYIKGSPALFGVVLTMSALAVIGLSGGRAAVANLSAEAENGSVVTPATVINDASASGGKAVQFGVAATCPVSTPNVPDGPDPFGGCFPGPETTGVPDGTVLTTYTGPYTITANDTSIDKKIVNGNLTIRAKNVTITNSQINGAIINNTASHGTYSFTITDSTVHTDDINLRGLVDKDYVATRVDVSGGQSMAWCAYCTIQDSYLHSPLEDPAGAAANHGAHNSTVRMAEFATIKHNTLWCEVKEYAQPDGKDTSGCSANQTGYSHDGAPPFNSRLEANLYMPTSGGVCAYGGSTTGALSSVHDIVFKDNIFKRGTKPGEHGGFTCGYYSAVDSFDPGRPGNQWINNKWDDGTSIGYDD